MVGLQTGSQKVCPTCPCTSLVYAQTSEFTQQGFCKSIFCRRGVLLTLAEPDQAYNFLSLFRKQVFSLITFLHLGKFGYSFGNLLFFICRDPHLWHLDYNPPLIHSGKQSMCVISQICLKKTVSHGSDKFCLLFLSQGLLKKGWSFLKLIWD